MALICHAKKRRFHDGEFDKDQKFWLDFSSLVGLQYHVFLTTCFCGICFWNICALAVRMHAKGLLSEQMFARISMKGKTACTLDNLHLT